MPAGFVSLEQLAPQIVQEIRYAGPFNFTGAPLPGYQAPRCWLVREAAVGLAAVDARLSSFGLGLKVWDCYRPLRASEAMVRWGASRAPRSDIERYFLGPLTRAAVMQGKFVAPRSRHNAGTTVDLTITPRGEPARSLAQAPSQGASCDEESDPLSFGTAHDCFSAKSATRAPSVSADARAHRALLVSEMRRVGFVNYAKEWWHFTLLSPPASARALDVPIR